MDDQTYRRVEWRHPGWKLAVAFAVRAAAATAGTRARSR
jgi:hypothetical protein